MELKSKQLLANDAARRWRQTYYRNGEWSCIAKGDTKQIYDALVALGETPAPEDVNRVIGTESWTSFRCDECQTYIERGVEVGEKPDYESNTAILCIPCLTKAMAIGTEVKP